MKKRIVTLSLALIFTLALFVPSYAAESETLASQGFDDIAPGSWCDEAARWAVEKGITNGTGGNNFSPTRTCSRAEIITFLWRAAGAPVGFDVGYSDVDEGEWYSDAAAWCYAHGLLGEWEFYTDGQFHGDADCTRADVVTYLWRLADKFIAPDRDLNAFEDVDAKNYIAEAVAWAVANDITTGTSETTFSPENTCTRGEIVTFIQRAYSGDAMEDLSQRVTDEILTCEEFVEELPKGKGLQLGYSNEGLATPGPLDDLNNRYGGRYIYYLEQERYVDFGNNTIGKASVEYASGDYEMGYTRKITVNVELKSGNKLTLDISKLPFVSPSVDHLDGSTTYCTYTVKDSCVVVDAQKVGEGFSIYITDEDTTNPLRYMLNINVVK